MKPACLLWMAIARPREQLWVMMMMMMASESLKVLEFESLRTQYLRCFEEAFWVSGDDGGVHQWACLLLASHFRFWEEPPQLRRFSLSEFCLWRNVREEGKLAMLVMSALHSDVTYPLKVIPLESLFPFTGFGESGGGGVGSGESRERLALWKCDL